MKAPFVSVILISLVLVTAAGPVNKIQKRAIGGLGDAAMQKVMEKGMVLAGGVMEKLKDSEVARKLVGKVFGMVAGGRAKRSITIAARAEKYNIAQYQKVEMFKTTNKEGNGDFASVSCPIDRNELNAIETVSIAVQQALAEVVKIINGRKVGYIIAKPKQTNA